MSWNMTGRNLWGEGEVVKREGQVWYAGTDVHEQSTRASCRVVPIWLESGEHSLEEEE